MKKLAFVLALMCSSTAFASCDDFKNEINEHLKAIAQESTGNWSDNSAPRETMRQTRNIAHYTAIGVIQAQLQYAKCPASPKPIDADLYFSAALACETAKIRPDAEVAKEKCNSKNWTQYGPNAETIK